MNVASLLFAAQVAASVGPSQQQLTEALVAYSGLSSAPVIRGVRCKGFEEEPTEFVCTWRQRDAGGRWLKWSTYLAIDGERFVLIDEPSRS